MIREAYEAGLQVQIRGQGTKRDWGVPPQRVDLEVDTGSLTGVVEHAAGDLVAVVRAGTPLRELQEVLATKGQQLAIDETVAGASVGGTVAANTSGPRRLAYGTIRDLLIGVTVVRPDGTIARAGGKVVKNVAGYDLCKLFTGSCGTLGLITECVFRLHPLPRSRAFVQGLRPFAAAAEIDGEETVTLIENAGDEGEAPPWWGRYPWQPGEVGLKLTAPLSRIPEILALPVKVRGSLRTGVLYAALPADTTPETIDLIRKATPGHAVVVTAPPGLRQRIDMWGPVPGLELMRRVKRQFDPKNLFAPGTFVGGI